MDSPIAKIDAETEQVRKQIEALRSRISSQEKRLAALSSAREVLVGLGYGELVRDDADDLPNASKFTSMKTKDLIVEALSKGQLWRTANDVQEVISEWAGRQIPMSTVSPYLSEMKKDGSVVRKGMSVAAALRVEKEEPSFFEENGEAEASPETDEVGASSNEGRSSIFD